MGVRLPAEYQEVEYLEATGTQAFFTDVPIQDNLTVDSVQTFVSSDNYLFGGHSGKGLQSCFNGYWNSRVQNSYAGYYHWALDLVSPNNTTIYHVVSTQRNGYQSGYLNGELILNNTKTTTADTSAGETAVAFGQRSTSGTIKQFYRGKVYSLKVSKDGVQLADYVPCYRKADTKPGMYDLVSDTFYINEGTGEFLVGPDVIDSISPLMVAWRMGLIGAKATYVEYTPINKVSVIRKFYIDTEYIPSSKSSAEMKYMGTNPQHHFLACEHFYFLSPRSISNRCGEERLSSSLVNQVATISCYRENDDIVVNGTKSGTLAAGTEEPTTSLYLLSYHGGGVNTYGFIGDFYYARIYDNDVLIRNYIPVKDSLGRVGILESISKRFWYGTDEDPAFSE